MDRDKWAFLQIQIVRFVDEHQPGIVAAEFLDGEGKLHTIIDKIPVLTIADLGKDSEYPQPSIIPCELVATPAELVARGLVRINIDRPCVLETTDGETEFIVHQSQLSDEPLT